MTKLSRWISLFCALTLVSQVWAQGFSVRRYQPSEGERAIEAALDSVSTYASEKAIARDFQARYPNDIAVQFRAASILAMDNMDSTRAHYQKRAEDEPDNEAAVYLAGRMMTTPADQRVYAEKLLARDPNSYWGNLLQAGAYTPESDSGFHLSEAALRKAIARDNSLPYAVERLGHLLRARNEKTAADDVYQKLCEMQPNRFEPVQYRMILAVPDQRKAIERVDEFLRNNPDNIDALYAKARAQREIPDWPAHVQTMRRIVEVKRRGEHAYDLACGFSLAGEKDSAYAWLFTAADLGFSDIEQYKSDDDLVPLRSDPRWNELLVKVEDAERARMAEVIRQAAATAPQRKQEAVADRQSILAPDFSLKDLDGKTVSLASLRGKVVILDFWATWCGPCKKTMPLLDQFFREKKPENVEVYGVNVWERGGNTDKVKPFLAERKIAFPVLFGTDDLATAYGVRGIPTLVMIDQQGKIAYRHVGYTPTLAEELLWQANELLKK